MVSALDSGFDGPGSSPGRGTALCSWARHFTPIVPLSTQVCGRRGGLMVSALDSGSDGPGSSPGRGTALCS